MDGRQTKLYSVISCIPIMITRYQIQQAKAGAIQWFDHEEMLGGEGTVSKCAAKHVRGSPFSLDFKSAYNILDHIEFVYDDYWCHWARNCYHDC